MDPDWDPVKMSPDHFSTTGHVILPLSLYNVFQSKGSANYFDIFFYLSLAAVEMRYDHYINDMIC